MNKSYIILCRHGQRAPGRMLLPSDPTIWSPLTLPYTDPALAGLFDQFPIFTHVYNGIPHDQAKYPFGSITHRGADFAKAMGAKVAAAFPDIVQLLPNTQAYATNYRRTQITAQCLLAGMSGGAGGAELQIPITVNNSISCPMTFYDSHPEITNVIISKVLESEHYKSEANSAAVLQAKDDLTKLIPELGRGQFGFDWPMAFDYFTCPEAHRSVTSMETMEQLKPYEGTVLEHFVFRYWSYYRDPVHMSYFVSGLLAHIQRSLVSFRAKKGGLVLYSGHDINLFAFLMAIGDENTLQGPKGRNMTLDTVYDIWPNYASTIVLECTPTEDNDCDVKVFKDLQPLAVRFTLKELEQWMRKLQSNKTLLNKGK